MLTTHIHTGYGEQEMIYRRVKDQTGEEDIEIELTLSKRKRLLRQLKRDKRHCRTESSIFSHCKISQTEKPLSVILLGINAGSQGPCEPLTGLV